MLKENKLTIGLFVSLIILNIFNFTKEATYGTALIVLFVIFFEYINLYSENKNLSFSLKKFNNLFKNNWLIFSLFFLSIIITQNVYLNFEVITWDVPSYLVASQEINLGFLPMETQWESKGPLFLYLYNIVSNLVNNSYIHFRLANDLILLGITLTLYSIVYTKTNNRVISTFSGLFFITLTSKVWYISEYSELYSLIFISLAYLMNTKYRGKYSYFYIGFLLGLSTLINQGTVLFLIPFIFSYILKKNNLIWRAISLSIGFLIPHVLFIVMYFRKGLLDVYISNYIQLPLAYTKSSLSSFYELKVWVRGFYEYDAYLYTALFLIFIFFTIELVKNSSIKKYFANPEFLGLIFSLLLYFIAGHNYYHHLFYFLFFSSLLIAQLSQINYLKSIIFFIFISFLSVFVQSFSPAFANLKNLNETQSNYPLYQLAGELESSLIDSNDAEILSLDYVLLLYYLEKPNYSYLVHPSNHFDEAVVETLQNLNKIGNNHISKMIEDEPRIIICNPRQIINGNPQRVDTYNCAIADYKFNYQKLDTEKYQNNVNLEYYKNPYQTLDVYIRQD